MKRLSLVLPLLGFSLLLAGCGGSDKDQVATGLSKAQYVSKAEVICTRLNKEIDGLTAPTSPAALESFLVEALRIAESGTAEIKALDPPEADKAAIRSKVLDPLEGQVAEGKQFLEDVKAAVAKNDQAALGKLISDPPTGPEADLAWMRSYGFKECVESAKTDG
ncbi:MAG TPA: hypothetical protein VM097_12985 [Mycobacteriales bacterium]|nr:hypothetical protein [Mycobacteriales bacterium]